MISILPRTWSTPGPQPGHPHGFSHREMKVWRQRCAVSFLGGWFGIPFTVESIVVWLESFPLPPYLHHVTATTCPWGHWHCPSAYSCKNLFLTWPWIGPAPDLSRYWGFLKGPSLSWGKGGGLSAWWGHNSVPQRAFLYPYCRCLSSFPLFFSYMDLKHLWKW